MRSLLGCKPIQGSMVAHLHRVRGGFTYWWYDGQRTCWADRAFRHRDQAVAAVVKAGFGRYEVDGKVIPLA
jgi:hypothetical protein